MSASIVIPNFVKDPRRSYTDCLTEDDLLVISLAITEFCAAKEAARNNGMPIDPLVVSPRSGRIQRSAHSLAAVLGWPRVMIEAAFEILAKQDVIEIERRNIDLAGKTLQNVLFASPVIRTDLLNPPAH